MVEWILAIVGDSLVWYYRLNKRSTKHLLPINVSLNFYDSCVKRMLNSWKTPLAMGVCLTRWHYHFTYIWTYDFVCVCVCVFLSVSLLSTKKACPFQTMLARRLRMCNFDQIFLFSALYWPWPWQYQFLTWLVVGVTTKISLIPETINISIAFKIFFVTAKGRCHTLVCGNVLRTWSIMYILIGLDVFLPFLFNFYLYFFGPNF